MKIGTTLITVEFVDTNVWVFTTNQSEPRHQTALDLITPVSPGSEMARPAST